MARTAVIVQARMASTRLPGKVLLELAGHTALAHVLQRCRAIAGVDAVVCATTEAPDSQAIVAEALQCGALVYRGSECDVLARYYEAARSIGADIVMRVTSDCPLIDPEICGRVLALVEREGTDYACNNMPPMWPHGLDCEAFTFAALERAAAEAKAPEEREHVTPWMRRQPGLRRANLAGPGGALPDCRWTLDYPDDYAFFRAVFGRLPGWPAVPGMGEVLAVLASHPEIAALNAGRSARSPGPARGEAA
ncbi:MAG: cytidylyltransferase domain-containing protein [Pseudomonadota bacterium]